MAGQPIDHRRLGRELDLFASDPLVGAGLPLWLPAGAAARHAVEEFVREQERRAGYQHVDSPPLGRREMYERSGHLGKFGDDMFAPIPDGADEKDSLVLRPSICTHHAVVFASRGRSYRDLPLRIAEMGQMYRAERSGVLSGLSRVRAISLNDAHNFCALEQVGDEVRLVLDLMARVHAALGFAPSGLRLSLRGGARSYLGDRSEWDLAESMLRGALVAARASFVEAPGEAAFYGPKIDVQVVDVVGREWSLATVQIDFQQPARFDLSYVDAKARRRRPVMVHRSVVGSMERLFGHLIEVHQGAFPAWYAPVQVVVLPVSENQTGAADAFARACVRAGLRAQAWVDGSLGARIRAARLVPYLAVVGAREAATGEVSLRRRGGQEESARPIAGALRRLRAACAPPHRDRRRVHA
jgi:threonyl-tRNA synthetase